MGRNDNYILSDRNSHKSISCIQELPGSNKDVRKRKVRPHPKQKQENRGEDAARLGH